MLGDKKDELPGEKPARPGHGRKKREEFGAAKTVSVSHPELKPGQLCPCGCGFKLYRLKKSKIFRHFVGQVPIQVTFYELEQLRSNGCDSVFSAPLPEGVGPEHYDPSAVSLIALSKYGMGLPFYRQAALFACLGTPIAVATQYELVAEAAERIRPAYEQFVDLAAQGELAHYDDTSMKCSSSIENPRTFGPGSSAPGSSRSTPTTASRWSSRAATMAERTWAGFSRNGLRISLRCSA